jgi:hypothetical protein
VGIKRRPIEIYEIDEAFFAQKFGRIDDDEVVPVPHDDEE